MHVEKIKLRVRHPIRWYHPVLKDVPGELRVSAWKRIAVSRERRFIYIRIPKAANSTISMTLASHLYPGYINFVNNEKRGELAKKSFGSLLSTFLMTKKQLLQTFYVFSFFRNPYIIILSAFLDKIHSGEKKEFRWVAEKMGKGYLKQISFPEFISFLENDHLYTNIHWAPQTKICPFKPSDLHFAGKVENLDQNLQFVLGKLFKPDESKNQITVRENGRQNTVKRVMSYYNNSLADRVYSLYHKDFELLGYSKDWLG